MPQDFLFERALISFNNKAYIKQDIRVTISKVLRFWCKSTSYDVKKQKHRKVNQPLMISKNKNISLAATQSD